MLAAFFEGASAECVSFNWLVSAKDGDEFGKLPPSALEWEALKLFGLILLASKQFRAAF